MYLSETVWTFKTARFEVTLRLEPETLDPAECFEFQEDIEAVRSGEVDWFCAVVEVRKNGHVIGSDLLGGCAYRGDEFWTAHRDRDPMNRNCSIMRAARGQNVSICHYFPDMVRQAIREARSTLEQ